MSGDDWMDLIVQVVGAFGMLGVAIQYAVWIGRSVQRPWLRHVLRIVPLALLVGPLVYALVSGHMRLAWFEFILFGIFTSMWVAIVLVFCAFFVVIEQVTGNLLFYKGRYWSKRYGTPMPADERLDAMHRRFGNYVWYGLKSWPEVLINGL